jgi:hypothetical protein
MPTFMDVRRKCRLSSNYKTFEDMVPEVFNRKNAELLKSTYRSIEDIDLYVGGALETFNTYGEFIFGKTFSCLLQADYENVMGADAYFYSHETNPYPFSTRQIDALEAFTLSHFICRNTDLQTIGKNFWNFAPDDGFNPEVSCDEFNNKPFDFDAWKV